MRGPGGLTGGGFPYKKVYANCRLLRPTYARRGTFPAGGKWARSVGV